MNTGNILFYINPNSDQLNNVPAIINDFRENGFGTYISGDICDGLPDDITSILDKAVSEDLASGMIDYTVVLGGDGTMIRASSAVSSYGIPILGINLGHLGYLTSIDSWDASYASRLGEKDFRIEKRIMLASSVTGNSGEKKIFPAALNDIIISTGPVPHLINIDVLCDSQYTQHYRADGIVFSTPTGSTAYSLSAGGPIISPYLDAICLTPVCPHALVNKPVVFTGDSKLELNQHGGRGCDVYVTVDGRPVHKLEEDETVMIQKSEIITRFIEFDDRNFLSVLNSKNLR